MESRVQFVFLLMGLFLIGSSSADESMDKPLVEKFNGLDKLFYPYLFNVLRCPPLNPCKMGNAYMDLYNEQLRQPIGCPPQLQRCLATTTTTTTSSPIAVIMKAKNTKNSVTDMAEVDNSIDAVVPSRSPCPFIKYNEKNQLITPHDDHDKFMILFHCFVPILFDNLEVAKKNNPALLSDFVRSKAKVANETTPKPAKSIDGQVMAKILEDTSPIMRFLSNALKNNNN